MYRTILAAVAMLAAVAAADETSAVAAADETAVLQGRIDAIAAAGGGTLTLTAGVYRTGALFFKPGVKLHLEKGAVIEGVDEAAGYPQRETRIEGETCRYYPALINADRCDGFSISGEGVIDGHGANTWEEFWTGLAAANKAGREFRNKDPMRPRLLYVSNSKNVDVSGVTFRNSKFWTTHFYNCENVAVHDSMIVAEVLKDSRGNELKGPSTDAIDIDKCRRFTVRNCVISVNDDGVAIKGGKGAWANDYAKHPENGPSSDVLIENCTFRYPTHSCLTLGSECPAADRITMRNCRMDRAGNMLTLKMRTDTPQRYSNVLVEGMTGNCGSMLNMGAWTQYADKGGRTAAELKSRAENVTLRDNRIACEFLRTGSDDPELFEVRNLQAEPPHHVFSMSCKVTSCNGELATAAGRERAIAWFRKNHITKLWLESYRHNQSVTTERLVELRDAFRAAGFEVAGMITPTRFNDAPAGEERQMVVCWSDPMARSRMTAECLRAAAVFDTVILDDFLFSCCDDGCASCKADKARRGIADWGEYRRALLHEICERDVLAATKEKFPNAHFIIKFPCWYANYAERGYDPRRQSELFGECWIGTETRDANPDALQACWIMQWMNRESGGRCGGGWYDGLDTKPAKFLEQAYYTILGGAKESLVHCYDYLVAEDPGLTPFGEKATGGHACAAAFSAHVDELQALADELIGAERLGFEMRADGVSVHTFRKDGRIVVVKVNTASGKVDDVAVERH